MTRIDDLTRPIVGIENRTAQEVFDIMYDRILAFLSPLAKAGLESSAPSPSEGEAVIETRNDEAGFTEFINEDRPTIVRDLPGNAAVLLDLDTRKIIGYRVYDPPAPAGEVTEAMSAFETALNEAPSMEPYEGRRRVMLEGVKLLHHLRSALPADKREVRGDWVKLDTDAGVCATDGCGRGATWRLEAGGVASNYCSVCTAAIQNLGKE